MPQLMSTRISRSFYKHTFELRDNGKTVYTHTLLLNPSDMSVDEPPRVNVVQTLGGAYVNDFGQGLPSVSIAGTTGYHARRKASGDIQDGFTEWKAFRDKVYRYYVNSKSSQVEMYWFNWEESEFYKVVPMSFRLMRNKSEAVLFRYELRFICVEKLGGQNAQQKIGAGYTATNDRTVSTTDFSSATSQLASILTAFKKGGYLVE